MRLFITEEPFVAKAIADELDLVPQDYCKSSNTTITEGIRL